MAGDGPDWSLFDDVFSQNLDDLVDKELHEGIVRFPEVSRENLTLMREENVNKNTKKSTSTWVKVFDCWRMARQEARQLEHIPFNELDEILCKFYAEARKKDAEEYEPESLAVMQAGLDRHLKNNGRTYCILHDREFCRSRQQLETKARQLRAKGYGKRKHASHALSEEDEEHLWKTGQLGKYSAEALTNVNFKNLTEHFGLRGRQEHYVMDVQDFEMITSPDNSVRYLSFKEGPTKTRQGGLHVKPRAALPKMFATGGERCPVMLFEELLKRRPQDLRTTGPIYLGIISKPKGDIWFSRQRMGEHKIGAIMKTMAEKSGLIAATVKRLTNRSSRKTCVQKLKKAGVPRDKIMDVTGHKNIQSLSSYEGDDENQTRELSNIISGVHTAVRNRLQTLHDQPSNSSDHGVLHALSNPLQTFQPSNSNVCTVQNTFTGTVNIYGSFPGVPAAGSVLADHESTVNQKKSWKRVKIFDDSDSD